MASDLQTQNMDQTIGAMPPNMAKPYIVDMLEQLMLLAQGSRLTHIASGLDALLEPYRE